MQEIKFINKLKNKQTKQLFDLLLKHGQVRFIGGCVRDALLGIEFSDIDLATNLKPEQVIEILNKAKVKVVPTGIKHGTVTAILEQQQYQITTLRKDENCDGRHADVLFTNDWKEDAQRRDFTINALSSTIDGELFDYFGGLDDLKTQKVRFIGNATERINEDYLRILRFYRFSAKYADCNFDSQTCSICSEYKAQINSLSDERIYDEFKKITERYSFYQVFSQLKLDGILDIIFPGVAMNLDLLESVKIIAELLKYLPDTPVIFAAMQYKSKQVNTKLLKKKNELSLFEALLSFKFDEYSDIEKEIRKFHYITGEQFKNFFVLLFAINYKAVYPQLFVDLFILYSKKERIIFPITGADLLAVGYKSGIEIGQKLMQLEKIWMDSDFKMGKEDLLSRI